MEIKKVIKGMLPDVKSTDMPEDGAYLIHNLRYKNGRLYPVDSMFKHLIVSSSDIAAATALGGALDTAPLEGRKPIYAFYANGKLIVINDLAHMFIANVGGSLREGEYSPFPNSGNSAARFTRIPYLPSDNDGDPLPQNLVQCIGFIPTKKLVGKTLYINGVGYVCKGVYSVGTASNAKWCLKLDGYVPVGTETPAIFEKQRLARVYSAGEYEYKGSDYGVIIDQEYEYAALAFNVSREVESVKRALCFKKGVPMSGYVYASFTPTAMSVLNTYPQFPQSTIMINDFAAEPVKQYSLWGEQRCSTPDLSGREMYFAVRFNKSGLPAHKADSKWRAKRVSLCGHNFGNRSWFEGNKWRYHYSLPYQGSDETDNLIIIPCGSMDYMGTPFWLNIYSKMWRLLPVQNVHAINCGDGTWYTSTEEHIEVEGLTIAHPFLKPDADSDIKETDDEYPQWGIVSDGYTAPADGTMLYSGRLGTVQLFDSSSVAADPSYLNTTDHAVVVNPTTFSQAVVVATPSGLVTFTPGESSYARVSGACGSKYCAYFYNMLILANTVELEWVASEASGISVSVTGYNQSDADETRNGYEIQFTGTRPPWVTNGAESYVMFSGWGLPPEMDEVACRIKTVRDFTGGYGVIVMGAITTGSISVADYTPTEVKMKPCVRREKVYEQTVRNSKLNSYMDFDLTTDTSTAKATALFGSFTPITGLAVLNSVLYVFKRDTITEVTYTGNSNALLSFDEDKFRFGGYGATSIGDKIYYTHPSKGVCMFDGVRESILSEGIKSVFDDGEWAFVPYSGTAIAVIPTDWSDYFYLFDEGKWSRIDGANIIPIFNSSELEYLEISSGGVYYCSMPACVRTTGMNWKVNAYYPAGDTNAKFSPTPPAFLSGSYAEGNMSYETPEYIVAAPLDSEKKDLAKRIKAITIDGLAGGVEGSRTVTCRVEHTHDRASNEPAAGDIAILDRYFDGKSECKVYPNVVGRDPFTVIRARREAPAFSANTDLFSNWVDETSISAMNIDIESSGENPRR